MTDEIKPNEWNKKTTTPDMSEEAIPTGMLELLSKVAKVLSSTAFPWRGVSEIVGYKNTSPNPNAFVYMKCMVKPKDEVTAQALEELQKIQTMGEHAHTKEHGSEWLIRWISFMED